MHNHEFDNGYFDEVYQEIMERYSEQSNTPDQAAAALLHRDPEIGYGIRMLHLREQITALIEDAATPIVEGDLTAISYEKATGFAFEEVLTNMMKQLNLAPSEFHQELIETLKLLRFDIDFDGALSLISLEKNGGA